MNKPKDENGTGTHAPENLWVEGDTWKEVKESLTDTGMSDGTVA
jgi:hypothetical protein